MARLAQAVVAMNRALHENEIDCQAFVEALGSAPEAFTPAQREAIVATYVERRTVRAAAEHLGLHRSALVERLCRAREALRAWWLARPRTA